MGNQVYKFGGKTFLQSEHGSIGNEAVGKIATLVMIWWARKLKVRLQEVKIENDLLKIYVDDVNGVFSVIDKGFAYKNGRLEYDAKKEKDDEDVPADMVTLKVIQDIANDIDSMIIMTIDCPSNYNIKRVPMLDIQVWINEEDQNKIYYSFYEKQTKCPFVMSKFSAMPNSKKIECLSQEVFRRLHNT